MNAVVYPSRINGNISASPSKSITQRVFAAALLKKGTSLIRNYGNSNDDLAALRVIQNLGAKTVVENNRIKIVSGGIKSFSNHLDCGESGLSFRMFTPIAALTSEEIEITGCGSLTNRPMLFFENVLPSLGVKVKSNLGKIPFVVKGPLIPSSIEIDGSLSSQFLTGLLLAYSAADAKQVTIRVNNLKSKPYIDLTLEVMKAFGLKLPVNDNYQSFYFSGEHHIISDESITYTVEGDWSGAAFLLVAGAIAGKIEVKGLHLNSGQADKAILEALKQSGALINFEHETIIIEATALGAFYFDATECPDLFPPLVALAAFCEGTTKIKGISRLIHKESNRGETLKLEFAKLGVDIKLKDDDMYIKGVKQTNSCTVNSHHDHRIAMTCAIAALRANGQVRIEDAEAINKSYPYFFHDLKQIGAELTY